MPITYCILPRVDVWTTGLAELKSGVVAKVVLYIFVMSLI